MKTITKRTAKILFTVLFLSISFHQLQAQNSVIRNQNAYWRVWDFNVNSGLALFNGDLSIFDDKYYP